MASFPKEPVRSVFCQHVHVLCWSTWEMSLIYFSSGMFDIFLLNRWICRLILLRVQQQLLQANVDLANRFYFLHILLNFCKRNTQIMPHYLYWYGCLWAIMRKFKENVQFFDSLMSRKIHPVAPSKSVLILKWMFLIKSEISVFSPYFSNNRKQKKTSD